MVEIFEKCIHMCSYDKDFEINKQAEQAAQCCSEFCYSIYIFYILVFHFCELTARKVWLASRNRLGDSRVSPSDDQERLVSVKGSYIDCLACCVDFAGGF